MIIGIGLPRTGTRSLSNALDILGYKGNHICNILGSTDVSIKEPSYHIDNRAYMNELEYTEGCIYIITYRAPEIWRKSISRFSVYNGPEIDCYIRRCVNYYSKNNIRFLVFNIADGWDPLCEFLNKDIPSTSFPVVK